MRHNNERNRGSEQEWSDEGSRGRQDRGGSRGMNRWQGEEMEQGQEYNGRGGRSGNDYQTEQYGNESAYESDYGYPQRGSYGNRGQGSSGSRGWEQGSEGSSPRGYGSRAGGYGGYQGGSSYGGGQRYRNDRGRDGYDRGDMGTGGMGGYGGGSMMGGNEENWGGPEFGTEYGGGSSSSWSSRMASGRSGFGGGPGRTNEGYNNYGGSSQADGWSGGGQSQQRGGQRGWSGESSENRGGQSRWGSQERGQYTGRGPKGYRRSDERIEEEINEALTRHGNIDATEIEVKVKDGEVTLTGTVDSREAKREAEDVAEECSGVHNVQNNLRVQRERMNERSSSDGDGQRSSSRSGSQKSSASGSDKNSTSNTSRSSNGSRSHDEADESRTATAGSAGGAATK